MPFPYIMPMGNERYLDWKINELGYLRLSATKMYVRHIGNRIPDSLRRDMGLPIHPNRTVGLTRWLYRISDWSPIKRILLFLYGKIFRLYYLREKGSNRER
jgi:hypothetical protein